MTSEETSPRSRTFRAWIPRVLAMGVGLVLLIAGLIKALDLELFVRQIKDYGIISDRSLLIPLAWGLIVLECGLGAGLLVVYRPRAVFSLTAMLFLVFAGVTGWGWLAGATGDCGCYGAWLRQTPAQATVENVILLTATIVAGAAFWHGRPKQGRTKTCVVAMASIVGLALPFITGLPTAEITPPPLAFNEETVGSIEVHGMEHVNLDYGAYLIVLMGTDCLHCQEAVPDLNILAETPDLPTIIALCTSHESECVEFTEAFQPLFAIGHIRDDAFWRLLGDGELPRFLLLCDGKVKRIWDHTIPDEGSLREELLFSGL